MLFHTSIGEGDKPEVKEENQHFHKRKKYPI